jgi:energy-coupling factor transporter ATP-binding protein EcfA2
MLPLWSERLREAVRAFRTAISQRARRELEVAQEAQTRTRQTEDDYRQEKQRIEGDSVGAQAAALARAEQARARLVERQLEERKQLEREYRKTRENRIKEYADEKAKLEADFRDMRWTTNTVYEADKRVAREHLQESITSTKALLKKLLANWRTGRALIEKLEFLEDIPSLDPNEIKTDVSDPWQRMQECADQCAADLHGLETMRSAHFITPDFINGWLPWLVLVASWLVLSVPGVLLLAFAESWDWTWFAVAVLPGLVLPVGYWWITRLRNNTNDRIHALWLSLRHAAHLARRLRPVCLRLAKKTYMDRKRTSFKRNRDLLRAAIASTRAKLHEFRKERDQALKRNDQLGKRRLSLQKKQHAQELEGIDRTLVAEQRQAKERTDLETDVLEAEHARKREENHQWHATNWTALLRDWKQACDAFQVASRTVVRETERWFPAWSKPLELPRALPAGLPIGKMRWSLDMFPQGVPADAQLPRPDLSKVAMPALMPFPERASVLFRASDDGRTAAISALQAVLLRIWTSLPAGKVRSSIIDPVGRGENFAAFMHLADHDEKLVDYRIWTETAQIDERLSNLTLHMENVLQKYLRNQFKTLAEYNEQAGEVAEPFHFLVIANFPVNFSEDAARRLVSLASAGARCGIYVIVLLDTKQPMPHGFNVEDLEKVCILLDWSAADKRFIWDDADFGMFPLELEQPPPPERCTELLKQIGEEAVRASRVEVPFEWIMPGREAWWKADSAAGIRVPIGRVGAQGRQLLELGEGTSQHVLVAGKTGSGKSTLLHVLITQLAMLYRPSEIELYLIDFKKGVEFKSYASLALPHARVVAVESEREFGLSVLQRLDAELSRRGEIYRGAGVNDLASYREYIAKRQGENGQPHLPRIMLIVDEFQEFFIEDDKLAQEASLLLDRLVRQGRAFGMHVLLGSQTIGGAYSLARSTIDQMAVRIALQCSEADAHLILSRDNTEARLLTRPGEGIYNAMHGLLEGNHLFQVVWLGDNRRDDLLRQVRDLGMHREEGAKPIVFEGAVPADLTQNRLLKEVWQAAVKPTARWQAWLGDAVAIKDPTSAVFRKQSGSNLLVLGQQEEMAAGLTVSSLISLSGAIDPALAEPSLHLVLGQALDPAAEALVNLLCDILPIKLWPQRELPALLNQLADEIDRRAGGGGPPQFLLLHGLQRMRDLRRPDDDFGFSRKGEEKTPHRQFTHILREGPPVGVFTLLWCDTLLNLQRSLDRPTMREFDQRVLMQMSAADSSTLMDSPVAAKLGAQRALYYTEDQGKIEKFRPYALPGADWVRDLQVQQPDLQSASTALH